MRGTVACLGYSVAEMPAAEAPANAPPPDPIQYPRPPSIERAATPAKRCVGDRVDGLRGHLPRRPREAPRGRRATARRAAAAGSRPRCTPIDAHHRRRALGGRASRSTARALGVHRSRPGPTCSRPGATSSQRKVDAGQHDLGGELSEGVVLLERGRARKGAADKRVDRARAARRCATPTRPRPRKYDAALGPELSAAVERSRSATAPTRARASRCRSRSTACGRASAPGTSSSRAPGAASRRVEAHRARARRAGLRRPLPAADPPDRRHQPQGPQQHARGRPGRPRLAVRDRRRRGRPRGRPPRARHARGRALAVRDGARARHGRRARLRDQRVGRPPVADRAPRVVPPPPRRHAQVRREPAQELPGHLQRQLGLARTGAGCGTRGCGSSCTGSTPA